MVKKNGFRETLVKIPTPHSIPTLVKKRSSASNLSLNPPKLSSHRKTADFSSSKYRWTIVPGIFPASIAAAKSFGKLSSDLPESARAMIASPLFLSPASPSSPPPPPPLLLPPMSPPPPPPLEAEKKRNEGRGAAGCRSDKEEEKLVAVEMESDEKVRRRWRWGGGGDRVKEKDEMWEVGVNAIWSGGA